MNECIARLDISNLTTTGSQICLLQVLKLFNQNIVGFFFFYSKKQECMSAPSYLHCAVVSVHSKPALGFTVIERQMLG